MDMNELRVLLYEGFVDVAAEGIEKAREAKLDDADISAAILVEYLLGGASVALVNQISLTEFLVLAKDSYGRMVQDVKAYAEQKAADAKAEFEKGDVPVVDYKGFDSNDTPTANVVPFPKNKTLH